MSWPVAIMALVSVCFIIIFLPLSISGYDHYWILIGLVILFLLFSFICLRQIYFLYKQHKHYVFGNRLAWRLVSMFTAVSIIPGGMVWFLSSQFLTQSIDSWFQIPIQKALDHGIELGRYSLQSQEKKMRDQATFWSSKDFSSLKKYINQPDQSIILLNSSEIIFNKSPTEEFLQDKSIKSLWADALLYPSGIALKQSVKEEPVITLYHPFQKNGQNYLLIISELVPSSFAIPAKNIEETRTAYQKLVLSRIGLKHLYGLSLGLSFAVALSCALALALGFARRLVTPLAGLVEGTEAISQGDFSKKQIVFRQDELGTLSSMFNRMTDQLHQAQAKERSQRQDIESAKNYLESILSHLNQGIISFDEHGFIRMYNQSTEQILATSLHHKSNIVFHDWHEMDFLQQAWIQRPEFLSLEYQGKTLVIQSLSLSPEAGGGYLFIINDISTLVQAQRHAAWGEVAKRLAHEIKNPLTPIQWSTERLHMKLTGKLPELEQSILDKSTKTIIKQVNALKDMVDAFRQYAKTPTLHREKINIHQLIQEVLFLYEHDPSIRFIPCQEKIMIDADPNLIRQVIHNLIQNAQDAVQLRSNPKIIVRTLINNDTLSIEFQDNGHGFSQDILPKVFDPYITNKVKGTGLGLAIVKRIIEEHHGSIKAFNAEPEGALLIIYLNINHA